MRLPDRMFAAGGDTLAAVVASVREVHATGRPVLVGTRSVAVSEEIGRLLQAEGLPHEILNARQDANEAGIVARAGEPGRITVATNMAGRGTDIKLADGVDEAGGLHVIATERHEARRIDRQLFGRCGRQGDRGSYQLFASVEDEVIALHCPAPLRRLLSAPASLPGGTSGRLAALAGWLAQVRVERHHARIRPALMESDKRLGKMLAFAGRQE